MAKVRTRLAIGACGVAVAFLRACEAGSGTSFDHAADETDIRRTLPNRDAAGHLARVGAVERDSNHADQLLIALAQADVGAGGTAGRTVDTLLRTAQQNLADQAPRQRMHAHDLPEGHVDTDLSARREWLGIDQVPRSPRPFPISRAGPWNIHGMDLEGKLALVTGGAELDELWSPAAMAA